MPDVNERSLSQAPSETCRNVTRVAHQRRWAVAKVTTSCPSERRKPHWAGRRSGHTPRWLAAAAGLTTSEDGRSRGPIRRRTWREGRGTWARARCFRSGRTACLRCASRGSCGTPTSLAPRPPSSCTSPSHRPHSWPSKAPETPQTPPGAHPTGRPRGGTCGRYCPRRTQTPCLRLWCELHRQLKLLSVWQTD